VQTNPKKTIEILSLNEENPKWRLLSVQLKKGLLNTDCFYKDGEVWIIGGGDGFSTDSRVKVLDVTSNTL